jgi:hypothetical protein
LSHLFSIIGRVSLGAARRAGEGEGTRGGLLPVLLIMGLILANGLGAGRSCAADGDEVTIRSLQDSDGGSLLIEWLAPIKVLQKKDDNRLILRFSRPLSDDPGPALDRLATYLDVERTTIEATDLVLVMKPDVSANLEIRKRRIVAIDFRREKITLADVTLNLSTLPNGMRLALDWPQLLGFEAAEEEGRLLAIFKSENRISDADLTYLNTTLQPWFREVRQARDPAGTSLSFDLQPMIVSSVRDDGAGRVIIDLTRDAMALADKSRTTIVPALRPKPPPAPSAEPDENPPPIPKRRPPVTEASTAAGDAEPTEKALSAADDPVVDELVLDWGGKVASAVFKRAGHLWVVVDALPEASKIPLPPPAPLPLMEGELLQADGATVMRFRLQTDRGFKIGRDDTGRLHIRPDSETEAPSPVSIAPADRPGSLRATAVSGGRLIDVIDPLVGDQLGIWTIQDLDIGQHQRRRFVDLEFRPSLQ